MQLLLQTQTWDESAAIWVSIPAVLTYPHERDAEPRGSSPTQVKRLSVASGLCRAQPVQA